MVQDNTPDAEVTDRLKTLGIVSLCQWDLLMFLYRHQISLFGADYLVRLSGYPTESVVAALDALESLGLVGRSRISQGARYYQFIAPSAPPRDEAFAWLLALASHRDGRLRLLRQLPRDSRRPEQRLQASLRFLAEAKRAAQQRADTLYATAPVEAGLAALSTLMQLDLSAYDLDAPLPAALQARATQGLRSQFAKFYVPGWTPTLREIATRKVSLDALPFIGTPQRVADSMARTMEAIGGDGFAIRQGLWPGYVDPFVEQVVPLLQQRGVVRQEYTGRTLREHLQEF